MRAKVALWGLGRVAEGNLPVDSVWPVARNVSVGKKMLFLEHVCDMDRHKRTKKLVRRRTKLKIRRNFLTE